VAKRNKDHRALYWLASGCRYQGVKVSCLGNAFPILQSIQQSTGTASSALERISDSIVQNSVGTAQVDTVIHKTAGIAARNQELAARGRQDAEEVRQASASLNTVIAQIGTRGGSSAAQAEIAAALRS
jgi:hypothetical protein